MRIVAKQALLPKGWAQDVAVEIAEGRILSVGHGVDHTVDVLLPAPVNLHSHAFQRAMAGLTEYRTSGQDSFWTWRSLMYRFLDQLTPEDVGAIAAQVMVEMAEAMSGAVATTAPCRAVSCGSAMISAASMRFMRRRRSI